MADAQKRLAIHLNDQLALATGAAELARRALGANRGDEFGTLLERLRGEYAEDRSTLLSVMASTGVSADPVKQAGGWVGEKLGRLKLNGQLTGYSPLSRLIELDGLITLATLRRGLWGSLAATGDPRLAAFDFPALQARADAQIAALEEHRRTVARAALRD